MEARIAKLEAAVSHIERDVSELRQDVREIKRDQRADFRLMFGAIIAVALGLAGLMAKGFKWL
jgi:tetrahydromethanopterin S-methyltransferase subunit F